MSYLQNSCACFKLLLPKKKKKEEKKLLWPQPADDKCTEMFEKQTTQALDDPLTQGESRGRLKMATREREPQLLRQQAASAMRSLLIEYLQNYGRNMNLAFVTEWQAFREYDEMGSLWSVLF